MINTSKNYRFILFAALGVLAFLLNITASRDWPQYLKHFSQISEDSWYEVFRAFSIFEEPLFYLNAKFFGEMIGFTAFILILTTILLTLKLNFLQKVSVRPWLAVYIYICLYLFLFEGTVIRVAYATALVIPALYYLSREEWWRSLLLLGLATQFHFTSTIFFLAVPLMIMPYIGIKWIFLLFLISPIFIFSQFSLFEYLANVVGLFRPDYIVYGRDAIVENQNSSGMFFYYVSFYYILVLISVVVAREHLRESAFFRVIAGLCMFAVIIMCSLHDHVLVAARLGELLLVVSPILITQAANDWPYSGKKVIVTLLVSGFALIAIARFAYLYPDILSL